MKLVASSKLRRAQRAIEALRPYESALNDILGSLQQAAAVTAVTDQADMDMSLKGGKTVVVALSSNTSLCGGFNSNVIKKALAVVSDAAASGSVEVWSVGRKMAEAMRKAGYPTPEDCNDFVAHPSYAEVSAFATALVQRFEAGEIARILLVYNHFVSSAKQVVEVETYLDRNSSTAAAAMPEGGEVEGFLVEPSPATVVSSLQPQVLNLKMYAAVLDSIASEHAARTVAMQTATDNAQDLLADLTLEYNKARQAKITSEILDLAGGAQQ